MKILIGADLVPTKSNIDLFSAGDAEALLGEELVAVLKGADYRIFNLEVPLADKSTPIKKCGPALIAPTATVEGYKAIGVDCLTIANNHIMDQGAEGFQSTVNALNSNGVCLVGGGENLAEAQKPIIVERDGKKIGIYACAEHEFSIAEEHAPGANPFDPLESLDHVAELKERCDFVVILYHGGKEHYRYPSPNLQKVCRKLVDKGADLVICQHSHCIGCEEKYQGGTIVYGQGNFLFDLSQSEFWQTSLLVEVGEDFSVSYIPLVKSGNTVRLASEERAKEILGGFVARSEEIKDPDAVQRRYYEFAMQAKENYLIALGAINTKNIFFRVINKLSGYKFANWVINRKFDQSRLLAITNYVDCEAHRELLVSALIGKKDK